MSEKLTIEILKQKFKEAQEKGEELIFATPSNKEVYIYDIGVNFIHFQYVNEKEKGYEQVDDFLEYWRIKQLKDEYEILTERLKYIPELDCYRVGFYSQNVQFNRANNHFTGRKLLRNKNTGEICEYDEDKLK